MKGGRGFLGLKEITKTPIYPIDCIDIENLIQGILGKRMLGQGNGKNKETNTIKYEQ